MLCCRSVAKATSTLQAAAYAGDNMRHSAAWLQPGIPTMSTIGLGAAVPLQQGPCPVLPSGSKFVTCSIRSATEVARASLPLLLQLNRGSVWILTLRLALLLSSREGLLGPSSPRERFLSCSSAEHLSTCSLP